METKNTPQAHTKEPWRVGRGGRIEAGLVVNPRIIADVTYRAHDADAAYLDSRRIVACVNALAGIQDPAAAIAAAREALEKIAAIERKEIEMTVNYPAGTVNAEDAWREFSKEKEAAWDSVYHALTLLKGGRE